MTNYRTRFSEIDIIAQDREALVFIEVKFRSDDRAGNPLEAVNLAKQKKIRNASLSYMRDNDINPDKTDIRYDVIGIMAGEIMHIKGAF